MTLHPILVHFPIALLSLYGILELLRFPQLTRLSFWKPLKGVLVVAGAVAAYLAKITGEMFALQLRSDASLRPVLEAHSSWANITVFIFGLIGIAYVFILVKDFGFVDWLETKGDSLKSAAAFLRRAYTAAESITSSYWILPVALFGLVAVTITGALGGSMVYGPHVDPAVEFIYRLYGFPQ